MGESSTLIFSTVSPEQRSLMFPKLTDAQIARATAHGRVRALRQGEVLIQPGDHSVPASGR